MCPGGQIVASVSAPGLLCTNGMSNSRHSSRFANAAVVTTLGPREFGAGAFAGVALQEALERRCFEAGGGDYTAPGAARARLPGGRRERRARALELPLRHAPRADRRAAARAACSRRCATRSPASSARSPATRVAEGLLVGIESRSSGPVRIPRDPETLRARGFANLFPVGEGAGSAGGIMSAAIDGARAAQALLRDGL